MSLVKVEKKDRVAYIGLNRPEKKNALSPDVLVELESALKSLENVTVVVIKGEGGFFSAGGDISVMFSISGEEGERFSRKGNEFMDFLQNYGAITIAAMEGGAYGGGLELALSCDLRIASPQTKMGLTEIILGLFPGWGGVKRMARIAGVGTAKYLTLTGKIIDGNEAYRLGLVSALADDPVKSAEELAVQLSQRSSDSIKSIKTLLGKEEYSTETEEKLFGEILETPTARATLEKFLKK